MALAEREEISRGLAAGLMMSLTWDRGKDMARHKLFSIATGVAVYVCDPQSPWRRASNQNTNGLPRQCFPKAEDLPVSSQKELDEVAAQVNARPRMTLGYSAPANVLADAVATTG